ncbi:MAG: site-specific DNA-methyltransferase [Anaerolineales bacterium]|nr:site-specific DNA-methyltransferase [Anaerolineales bacterium]
MLSSVHNLDLTIKYVCSSELDKLQQSEEIFDVILVSSPFDRFDKEKPFKYDPEEHSDYLSELYSWLEQCHCHLNKDGSLLVYGLPRWLPYFAEYLHASMIFKYWIVIKNPASINGPIFPAFHEGVLLFVNNKSNFTLNKVRYPHIMCSQCEDYLADWGGKKHLRHPYGPVISDVWDDREDFIDEAHGLAPHTVERLLELTCKPGFKVLIAAYNGEPYAGTTPLDLDENLSTETPSTSASLRKIERVVPEIKKPSHKFLFSKDEIFIGDTIEIMSDWVSDGNARFDLIFADPPYNLEKGYGKLDDDLEEQEYIQWCDQWLNLCTQLLKPTGSLYVLNLPKWTYFHATLLNQHLYFQQWIAWDALSEPRGRVMPAHYGLLLYTKHPTEFTYNSLPRIPKPDQCFRSKCINSRPPTAPKEEISDIWYDVHRIKHKRDRDAHPCQLPIKLLERVIQISSNPGDLVLDPFLGTGTTAIVAKALGRYFIGTDIDNKYRDIALARLEKISFGENVKQVEATVPSFLALEKTEIRQFTLF